MKGQKSSCKHCNTPFTMKSIKHTFCSSTCRKLNHRKVNGIAEPEFMRKGVNKPTQSKPYELITSSEVTIRSPDTELLRVQQDIQYYETIISDAGANVFPLWMAGLGAAGLATGNNGLEKLALSLVGGFIGSKFDVKRKEKLINIAHENVRFLKSQKKQIKEAQSMAKLALDIGTVKQERKGVLKVIDTDGYKGKTIQSLGMIKNSPWFYLLGDPSKNFMAMLHGLPGNGKSTFSIQFADYFQKEHGNVLYIASEQKGLNKSFQDLLKQYVTTNFDIANDAKDHNYKRILKASKDYKLVIIDSINHIGLTAAEFEDIRDKSPNTAFLAIMQSAKDGNFKGSQEWAHNCDIIIEMKRMIAHQTKSRYAPPAQISVIT